MIFELTYSNFSYNIKLEFFELIDFNPIMELFNFRKSDSCCSHYNLIYLSLLLLKYIQYEQSELT